MGTIFECERCGMWAETDDLAVIGRNCPATDFERPHVMAESGCATTPPACGECGTPYILCGHRPPSASGPCSYTTSTADYCHTHQSHRAHADGRCEAVR